jgi:hypothetical protein
MRRRRRRLALVVALAAALVTATGTGGYTAAEADRGVNVAVVNDPNGLLGVEKRVNGCGNQPRLHVTNNLGQDVEVSATVVDSLGVHVQPPSPSSVTLTELDPEANIKANVVPPGPPTAIDQAITLNVTAVGSGVRIELTRTVTVECTGGNNGEKEDEKEEKKEENSDGENEEEKKEGNSNGEKEKNSDGENEEEKKEGNSNGEKEKGQD